MILASAAKAVIRKQILPRPGTKARTPTDESPVVVAGMFSTMNGIGKAAKLCYQSLEAAGLSPLAADTSGFLNQVQLPSPVPLTHLVPEQAGTLILFANPPEIERCLMALGLRRWHNWRIIGAWAWETSVAPAHWARQASFVSEIWAPSRFVADAFRTAYSKPVQIVPHAVASNMLPSPAFCEFAPSQTSKALHILTIADARSSLERKNPVAAVDMFRAAFPVGSAVKLTLKCRNLSLYPAYTDRLIAAIGGDKRIEIVDKTLSDPELARLLDSADILLSPHRSEGFGLHLAEAMLAGKCVVATGWSGNMEFMTAANSVLLPYTLVPVSDPTGVYETTPDAHWAEPDIHWGARHLSILGRDADLRRTLGHAARETISDTLGSAGVSAYLRALSGR